MERDTRITQLEDARQLKRMHLPLNLPITHRTFSADCARHWFDLMDAHGKFVAAVLEYLDGARAGSPGSGV